MPVGVKGFQKGHKSFLSPEIYRKIHESGRTGFQKGHNDYNSEESRKKNSLSHKGRKYTNEHKTNISKGRTGIKLSEITKEKLSNLPQAFKKGIPSWNKGIKIPKISQEQHWNWKGGVTPKNHIIRTSLEYKLWRKAVFERDNFTCQKYGIRGGLLRSHHINNFAEKIELRLAIDNGITLSEKAHREFHKIYGSKNNTKEQLEEFLCQT